MPLMTRNKVSKIQSIKADTSLNKEEILNDYSIAVLSRHLSFIGRREVLSGKAKFGIFGDGKEIAQIAYAKFFNKGDWRAGYYRDQTFMLAAGLLTAEEFFAQLYGNTDEQLNPSNSGRNFNNHFATRNINKDGSWRMVSNQKNSSSDVSPTSGQMPRLLGLAYASKLFRNIEHLWQFSHLSNFGNEVAFGTIGEASTSEGLFFETINAACVLQVPLAIAVWDDGYGISVPVELQTAKASISEALKGFQIEGNSNGCEIYTCKGWDYPALVKTFEKGIARCRKDHVPVLFHVFEMTQPLGHSTSGSHERYKSKERLKFEEEFDPIRKMKEWILKEKISDIETLDRIESLATRRAKEAQSTAWEKYSKVYTNEKKELLTILNGNSSQTLNLKEFSGSEILFNGNITTRKEIISLTKNIIQRISKDVSHLTLQKKLALWLIGYEKKGQDIYSKNLYNGSKHSLNSLQIVGPVYSEKPILTSGREILNKNFDYLFSKYPLLVTFGEDTGKIGDVNQGLKGMQQKYGDLRVTDTGIRESTIIGQGIGLAIRGFRPIAEIQYLDYLLFAIQTISDDLATIYYRTNGSQIAPLIIRTRGHRLIGMWHSGSPMGMIINSSRGVYLCVPRNMTQAAGFYNTLLEINNPAIVIEPLKAYENKEYLPENLGEFKIPLGIPEIVEKGTDLTIVSYGWCVAIAKEAAQNLKKFGISVEIIDVQTLIPFDVNHLIIKSIKKTNRVLFVDEDVPGGASAYMMQKVLEEQEAFYYLDSPPKTLTGQEHRPAYGTDGDYFSKPSADSIFEAVYDIMHDYQPEKYPNIYFKEF
jgi:pyruvate/2-oxoglutarate/acetoin dehydrogenase E1 component/TPP-dependent pyruvate/acetoin dehydrogenase alpha subunit